MIATAFFFRKNICCIVSVIYIKHLCQRCNSTKFITHDLVRRYECVGIIWSSYLEMRSFKSCRRMILYADTNTSASFNLHTSTRKYTNQTPISRKYRHLDDNPPGSYILLFFSFDTNKTWWRNHLPTQKYTASMEKRQRAWISLDSTYDFERTRWIVQPSYPSSLIVKHLHGNKTVREKCNVEIMDRYTCHDFLPHLRSCRCGFDVRPHHWTRRDDRQSRDRQS